MSDRNRRQQGQQAPAQNQNAVQNVRQGAYRVNAQAAPAASSEKEYWRRNEFAQQTPFARIDDTELLREIGAYDNIAFAVGKLAEDKTIMAGDNTLGVAYVILKIPSPAQQEYGALVLVDVIYFNDLIMQGMRVEQNPQSGKLNIDLPFRLYNNPRNNNKTERMYDTKFRGRNKGYDLKCLLLNLVEVSKLLQFDETAEVRQRPKKDDKAADGAGTGATGETAVGSMSDAMKA